MKKLSQAFSVFLLATSLAACSGGGDGGSSSSPTSPSPTTPATTSVSGAVSKGPVSNAAVNIFMFNSDGTQGTLVLDGITTDANGAWSANIPSTATGPFMIIATGGTFTDEYTGATVPLGVVPMRGILPVGATSAAITPITDAAVSTIQQMVTNGYASSPDNALSAVQTNYVDSIGFNPIAIIPPAPSNLAGATADQLRYAAVLGGISTLANDAYTQLSTGGNTPDRMEIIAKIADDFAADGSIDGYGNAAAPLTVNVGGVAQALNGVFTGGGNLSAAVGTYQGLSTAPATVAGAGVTVTPIDFTTTLFIDTTNPVVITPSNISISVTTGTTSVLASNAAITAFLSGATATDNIGVVGAVTHNAPASFPVGTTTVIFSASDAAGNTGTASATVSINVQTPTPDTTPPVITLLGTSPISVSQGGTYVDAGATALDDIDGDLTASITTNNTVNTSVVGAYQVTYNVSDLSGNAATQVIRTVNVAVAAPADPSPVTGLAPSGKSWMKLSISAPVPINLSGSIIVGNGSEIRMYSIGTRSLGTVNPSTVYSTVDGISWTETTFNTPTFQIKYMAWNGSKYIAIAISADGTKAMVTSSSDGTTWATPVDLGTVVNPLAIGSNGTTTIIAGGNGYIASSTDLATWTTRVARDKFRQVYHIQSVSWTGTQFIATGTRGHISTSPDGITWTDRTNVAVAGTGTTFGDTVTVAGKSFLKLRPAGAFVSSPQTIINSTDGVSWATSLTPSAASSSNHFHQPGIAKTGELIISYSEFVNFQEVRYVLSSTDGSTFKLDDISAVTAFNTGDVVFDRGGGIGHLFSLPTGTYSVINRLSSAIGLVVYKRQ